MRHRISRACPELDSGITPRCASDSYFTHAKILNPIHAKQRAYVGALKLNRKVVFDGREDKLQEVARQIPHADKKAVRVGKRCYWYFSKRMRIEAVNHPAEPPEPVEGRSHASCCFGKTVMSPRRARLW